MGKRKKIGILGSTGSIGTQSLDVISHFPEDFDVVALSAGKNQALLNQQATRFECQHLYLEAAQVPQNTPKDTNSPTSSKYFIGSLADFVESVPADLWIVATVGWVGVEPTLRIIEQGIDVALANKEVLVCAGNLVMEAANRNHVTIWPIDSEHNALMQCLDAGRARGNAPVKRLILTCSGGPFRTSTPQQILNANAQQTLKHPTWEMGAKITVDSSTLMNKGFEAIEAMHLFNLPMRQIEVVIHPQSFIHSMVEFVDGSIIAQMGRTDMRLPIQNILTQPHRKPTWLPSVDFTTLGSLDFSAPDFIRFPCLQMAYDCAELGGTLPCVLNAANEIAVQAHLNDEIKNGQIPLLIGKVLAQHSPVSKPTLPQLVEADLWARHETRLQLNSIR